MNRAHYKSLILKLFISLSFTLFFVVSASASDHNIELITADAAPHDSVVNVEISKLQKGDNFHKQQTAERDQFIDSTRTDLVLLYKECNRQCGQPKFIGVSSKETAKLERFFSEAYTPQDQIRRIGSLALFKARQLGLPFVTITIPQLKEFNNLDARTFVQGLRNSIVHSSQGNLTNLKIYLITSSDLDPQLIEEIRTELERPLVDMDVKPGFEILPREFQISPESSGVILFPLDHSTNDLVASRFIEKLSPDWNRLPEPGSGISAQKFEGRIIAGINFYDGNMATLDKNGILKTVTSNPFGIRFQSTLFWGRVKRVVPNHESSYGFWATIETPEGEKTFSVRSSDFVHVFATPEDAHEIELAKSSSNAYMKHFKEVLKQKYEEWSRNRTASAIFKDFRYHRNAEHLSADLMGLAGRRMIELVKRPNKISCKDILKN